MRAALVVLHRWTGIVLAVYVVVIGLSGAALVFHDEIAATFRAPRVEPRSGTPLTPDQIVERLRNAFPDWHLQTVWWPETSASPWFAEIRRGAVGAIGETARAVYVHPLTGDILKTHDYGRSVWRWLQLLHFNLLAGRDGRTVNGVLALATLFSLLTGLLLWWPQAGRPPLWSVGRGARPRRFLWELHQVTGIYLLAFAVALCVTGSYFAWRAPFHSAIAAVFPMRFMSQPIRPIEPPPDPPLPLAHFLPQVHALVPDFPVTRVLFPDRPDQPIRFVVYEGPRRAFYRASNLFFHPTTGELLRADLVRDRLAGDSVVNWIGAVHYGAFGGWPLKLLWTLGGLGFPLLAITGLLVYFRKTVK